MSSQVRTHGFRFVTEEQQREHLRRAKQRAKRPGQLAPTNRGKKKQVEALNQVDDRDLDYDVDAGQATGGREWVLRQQEVDSRWQQKRAANLRSLQKYVSGKHSLNMRLLNSFVDVACQRVAKAALSHGCSQWLVPAGAYLATWQHLARQLQDKVAKLHEHADASQGQQQEQQEQHNEQQLPQQDDGAAAQQQASQPSQQQPHSQQQQQRQPQQQYSQQQHSQQQDQEQEEEQQPRAAEHTTVILSCRLVACHMLGASFWLPVPTVCCRCCVDAWEVPAADAGFFGSSPEQPGVWFSCEMLDMYTHLFFGSSCSMTGFADTCSQVAVVDLQDGPPGRKLLPIDDR
jgi:hypothetical protein